MNEACTFLFEGTIPFLSLCKGETKQLLYFPFEKFPLIYPVSIFLMEKEMVYISHIISNCNVVENGRVNKCKFMFHFVIFFSNQDSAERNNVRLKRASEVSLGSARMLWTEMEQLKGKG